MGYKVIAVCTWGFAIAFAGAALAGGAGGGNWTAAVIAAIVCLVVVGAFGWLIYRTGRGLESYDAAHGYQYLDPSAVRRLQAIHADGGNVVEHLPQVWRTSFALNVILGLCGVAIFAAVGYLITRLS